MLPWAYVSAVWTLNDNGRKEMFYLTTHSTHFIYGYMASKSLYDNEIIVCRLLIVSMREDALGVLNILSDLKNNTLSEMEPILYCEPSTDDLDTVPQKWIIFLHFRFEMVSLLVYCSFFD